MSWMIIPLVLVVFMIIGIRVIRAKDPTREQDSTDVRKWEEAKRKGFIAFCLRQTFPFVLGYCVLGPAFKLWKESGRFGYPKEEIVWSAGFAVGATLVIGGLYWLIVRAGGLEAKAH